MDVHVVGKIEPGSLLVFHDELDDHGQSAWMVAELKRVAGHDQFALVFDPNHDIELAHVGPELLAQIKEVFSRGATPTETEA